MLQLQQLHLFADTPGVARQAAVCADHTVTGNDDGNLIMPHRAADSLSGHLRKPLLFGKLARYLAVGHGLAVRDLQEDFPHGLTERGADRVQRRHEIRLAAVKINVQPTLGLSKNACFLLRAFHGQVAGKIFLPVEP